MFAPSGGSPIRLGKAFRFQRRFPSSVGVRSFFSFSARQTASPKPRTLVPKPAFRQAPQDLQDFQDFQDRNNETTKQRNNETTKRVLRRPPQKRKAAQEIKKPETDVQRQISGLRWLKGLEPSTFGATIRCSSQLSYNHRRNENKQTNKQTNQFRSPVVLTNNAFILTENRKRSRGVFEKFLFFYFSSFSPFFFLSFLLFFSFIFH